MNQMGYLTHPYGSYHSLAQAGGMGGTMMTSQMAMMAQQPSSMIGVQQNSMMGQQSGLMAAQGVMAPPSGATASPYMTGMTQGMMGQQQSGMMVQQQTGMMGQQQNGIMGQQQPGMMVQQQVGGLPHQQVYGAQPAQQLQWNITQVCLGLRRYLFSTIRFLKAVTMCVLWLSDDSARGRHESLQHQRHDGIQQSTHGRLGNSELIAHDDTHLEMMSYIQKVK